MTSAHRSPRFSAALSSFSSSGFSSPRYSPSRGTTTRSVMNVPASTMTKAEEAAK
jgi:hypothetical protein